MTEIRWQDCKAPKDWREVDRELGLPTDREVAEWAEAVQRSKRGQPTRRIIEGPSAQEVAIRILGKKGERAVARRLHLPMDMRVFSGGRGTRRVNFTTPLGLKIDVQTRRPPKPHTYPDILLRVAEPELFRAMVLVVWMEGYEPLVPGWVWEEDVRAIPPAMLNNTQNHIMGVRKLRPLHTILTATVPDEKAAQTTMFAVGATESDGGGFWSRKDR